LGIGSAAWIPLSLEKSASEAALGFLHAAVSSASIEELRLFIWKNCL
jgi:hypothetical protein